MCSNSPPRRRSHRTRNLSRRDGALLILAIVENAKFVFAEAAPKMTGQFLTLM